MQVNGFERKIVILVTFFWLLASSLEAQYAPVDAGSSVTFKVKNFGFNVDGSFKGIKGIIRFDPIDLPAANFNISIEAASVNTDNSMRDDHLRNENYFDVKIHPLIQFVSTSVTGSGKNGAYTVSGKLTIKGVSRDISFPFNTVSSAGRILFKGNFRINRRDFGVGSASTVSDNVDIFLEVLAVKI